jgi:propanol-preferring alcohol dehydrogenase
MRAMVLERPGPASAGPLVARELPDPEAGPGEVIVEVAACGVCRTDLQLCEGDLEAHQLPVVPGHQVVGRVVETGDDVRDREIGQRVGITWIAGSCGKCRFCESERENLCEAATFTGWDRDGGYAERVAARADFTFPLPDGFDDLAAAPLLCGGVIGYRSLKVSGIRPGGRLGLYGFGASATCVIQVARHWECEVFVATRSEREQDRARRLGAVWAGGYDEKPPEPLDAAITFAPVGSVVVDALRAVDRGGVVAVNAIHLDRVPEFPYELLWRERSLRSVANVTRRDVTEFLEIVAQVPVRTEYDLFPLPKANGALADLGAGKVSGAAVLTVG